MPVDERARHRLYLKLEELLGPEEAGTLMDHLPPTGFADLATKQDIQALRSELVGLIDVFEHRLMGRVDGVEGRMDSLDHRLTGSMDSLDQRLTSRMDSLEHRLTAKMERLGRTLVVWTSSMVLATAALAFAAGRFV